MDVMQPTEHEMARGIASAYFLTRAVEIEPIIGKGFVNYIFLARGAEKSVIIRMSQAEDEERGLAFYAKETWCLEQAARLGIPGPEVLEVGLWGTRPYMLQTVVPGVNGEECACDKKHIWHELGRFARLIHSVTLDGFGETLEYFTKGNPAAEWYKFIEYNLNSLTEEDELLRLGVYTRTQRDAVRRVFESLRERSFRFGLTHGDLSLKNTLVEADGQVHLLDWGSAEAHIVPHYELYGILIYQEPDAATLQAFLTGYGMEEAEFARVLPELHSLILLKSFDLTRWAIDRCPERIDSIAGRARLARQRFLDRL